MRDKLYGNTILQLLLRAVICLIVVAGMFCCTTPETPLNAEEPDSSAVTRIVRPAFLSDDHTWADSILKTMTLDEKIGQLIMVRAYSNQGYRHRKDIEKQIEKYGVGGLIFFQGGPGRQAILTNRYQSISKIPLFIAMDGEWGLGMRLDSVLSYPYQMTLGAIQDDQLIKSMAEDMGQQFRRLGVQWNLAPVVDVNNNANNPVINYRSFGEDKYNVVLKSQQYIAGLEKQRILTALKHFPGHGDTSTDSHKALPVIDHELGRLENIELFPFIQLIQKGALAVMVGHLSVPALDSTQKYPTSLSKTVINELLKNEMGFEGLVISDAMDMRGLTDYVEKDSAEVLALLAGNDIIELVEDVEFAVQSIKKAVLTNKIPASEIDQKCRKVLLAKYWTGLFKKSPVALENLYKDLNDSAFVTLISELYRRSITLLENKDSVLNNLTLGDRSVAVISVGSGRASPFAKNVADTLRTRPLVLPRYASHNHTMELRKNIEKADYVLLSLHQISRQSGVKPGYGKNTRAVIEELLGRHNVVLVSFRNPYVLSHIKNVEKARVVLLTYQDNEVTQNTVLEIFNGNWRISGKLPVTINDNWRAGHGITLEK